MSQFTFGEQSGLNPIVPVTPDTTVCAGCNGEADRVAVTDRRGYCDDCYSEDFTECNNCNQEVARNECNSSSAGDDYCSDCYCEHFSSCEGCSDELDRDNGDDYYGNDGCDGPYCQSCYERRYTRCDQCECEVSTEDVTSVYHTDFRGRTNVREVCESCRDNDYSYCDTCDEYYSSERVSEYRGDYVCDDCRPSRSNKAYCEGDNTFIRNTSRRKFGVELETSTCPDFEDHTDQHVFSAEEDGSINGMEFVSPVLSGDKGFAAIEEFCAVAEENDYDVDSACGFHAHFDVRDLSADQLRRVARAYRNTYEVWASFVSESRRKNTYCSRSEWDCDEIAELHDLSDWKIFARNIDRYQWLNIAAYAEHGTFEVRLHSATLNARKVCNWIAAHTKFIDAVSKMTDAQVEETFVGYSNQVKFEALAAIWGDAELASYFADRARTFGTAYYVPAGREAQAA